MNKITNFIKKKYKILIPIMVVFVLLITVFYLYKEYKYDNYRNKVEYNVYQCFGNKKKEYTAIVTYNLKDVIVDIEDKDKRVQYSSIPVYFMDEEKILFPAEMSIVFPQENGSQPQENGSQYKLYKYTTYEKKDDIYRIVSGRNNGIYNHFFLFDNKGLYFFSDSVTLKLDGEDYVTLGANSYAEIYGGYTLTYYDTESDKVETIELDGKKVTAENNYLKLSLSDKYYYIFDEKTLLIPSYNLNGLLND